MEGKAHILIVDDNESLCTAMSFVLSRKGYSVATASDGMEAIELVKESPFDLILLGVKLLSWMESSPTKGASGSDRRPSPS